MPVPTTPDHHRELHDDELEELPPLDGDGNDPESTADTDEEDIDGDDEDGGGLDDSTGEDDETDASDLDLDGEDGWLNEADDAADLDIGGTGLLDVAGDADGESALGDEVDERASAGRDDEDYGLGDRSETGDGTLDPGEEGPLDKDEDLRDEDLPAMDADDETDPRDGPDGLDEGIASDEPRGLPWAAEPWQPVGAPVSLAGATGVACVARGALVAGRSEPGRPESAPELLRIDLEGGCQSVEAAGLDGGAVVALTVAGERIAVVVDSGRVLESVDGGRRFEPVLVSSSVPSGAGLAHATGAEGATGEAAAEVALVANALWIRTSGRELLVRSAPGAGVERCKAPGRVAAIARDGDAGIVALVVDDADRPIALLRGGAGATLTTEPIEVPVEAFTSDPRVPPSARAPSLLAVRGPHLAYAGRRGIVRREVDGTWKAVEWDEKVTAIAFVDDSGTLLAATYTDADDTTGLVRVGSLGHAAIAARVGAQRVDGESDGRALALACDDARGVVWVVGGFGLAAFAIR